MPAYAPPIAVSYADWRPGDQPVYVSDIRRAEAEFGWRPVVGWQQGVDQLACWIEENKALLAAMF